MTFAPKTWLVGEVVSAATMNTEIRDQFSSMLDAWTVYSPSWTAATTNPVVNNGILTGRYMKIGRTCHVQIDLTCGSTTTYGSGAWSMGLPFAAAAGSATIRSGTCHAFLSQRYLGQILVGPSATSGLLYFPASGSVSNLSAASSTVPVTWANGAQLRISFTYETST